MHKKAPGLILTKKNLDNSSDKQYYHSSQKKANIQLIFCREAKYKAGRNLLRITKGILSCGLDCDAKISVFEKEGAGKALGVCVWKIQGEPVSAGRRKSSMN